MEEDLIFLNGAGGDAQFIPQISHGLSFNFRSILASFPFSIMPPFNIILDLSYDFTHESPPLLQESCLPLLVFSPINDSDPALVFIVMVGSPSEAHKQ